VRPAIERVVSGRIVQVHDPLAAADAAARVPGTEFARGSMTESQPSRSRVDPPLIAAPPPFVERRGSFRRRADRDAYRETTLLARSLDVLAVDAGAEARLAGLLDLLAHSVGARRAAVLADRPIRRVAVSRSPDEPDEAAEELAAWLDAWAPRPRPHRVADAPAPVAIVVGSERPRGSPSADGSEAVDERHYACLPIETSGGVVLGFDFADKAAAAELEKRLPPQLGRHAAVALALVTEQLVTEREVEVLRAQETERDQFVSTVAHELRTPLTALSGYLELILAGQVADEADELDFLERGREIVSTMSDLVGDLLELSKMESGALRLDLAPFSVTEVVSRVVGGLAPMASTRGVELVPSLPPRLKTALGDRRRVEQILTNLLANAVKFAPAGSSVEVVASFDGSVAVVAVRDEGAGITTEDRVRIFEPFHRLADHERITGTGLGLPIARDLARRMGADLDVASVPGTGSSFVLVLPGPTGATEHNIAHALELTLNAEEVRLEERAVLRAIEGPSTAIRTILRIGEEGRGSRSSGAVRRTGPRLVSSPNDGSTPRPKTGSGTPGTRPALRSIDGLASHGTDPSPA
jgi:signal transduction histidine kinase